MLDKQFTMLCRTLLSQSPKETRTPVKTNLHFCLHHNVEYNSFSHTGYCLKMFITGKGARKSTFSAKAWKVKSKPQILRNIINRTKLLQQLLLFLKIINLLLFFDKII